MGANNIEISNSSNFNGNASKGGNEMNDFRDLKSDRESAELREEHEGRTILPAGRRQKSKLPEQDNHHDGEDGDGDLVRFPVLL